MSPASPMAREGELPTRRSARRGERRRRPLWARLLKWFALACLTLAVLGAAVVAWLYSTIDIPDANPSTQAQISTVYFADGKTEMGRLSGGTNRQNVPLSAIPPHVQKAFLAAEDRSFYTNKGVSPSGIARAIKVGIQGGRTQGGSTITQQYVKNTFLTRDQTISRKVKEIIISVKLDQQVSKDEILERYLNAIEFGRGAAGIQAASQAYFGKDVQRLTPAEGALLASVIRGPSIYDPARSAGNLTRSKARVAWILDAMQQQGWLTAEQRSQATYPQVVPPKRIEITGGTDGYIVDMVTKELTTLGKLDEDQVKKGGLAIVTTVDKSYQDAMIEAIHDKGAADDIEGAQTGMTAIEPGTGEIKALYGGEDFAKRQWNNAVDAKVSAGSTYKAYTALAALRDGYSTKSRVSGSSPYELPGGEEVENEFNQQYGFIDVRQALADSVNTAFVRMNVKIGPDKTRKAAIDAGISPESPGATDDAPVNTLGIAAVSVLENTNGYATIAAEGRRATPHLIRTARTEDGEVDYTASKDTTQAFDKDVAVDVTEALTHPITEGTATYARRVRRDAAGKTGTSEDHKEVWFEGFVPQLAAGCMIYKPSADGRTNEPLGRSVGGYKYCVPIWTQFMRTVLEDVEKKDFAERVGVNDEDRRNFSKAPKVTPTTDTSAPTGGGTATGSPTSDGPTRTRDVGPTATATGTATRTGAPAPTRSASSTAPPRTGTAPQPSRVPAPAPTAPAPGGTAPVQPTR